MHPIESVSDSDENFNQYFCPTCRYRCNEDNNAFNLRARINWLKPNLEKEIYSRGETFGEAKVPVAQFTIKACELFLELKELEAFGPCPNCNEPLPIGQTGAHRCLLCGKLSDVLSIQPLQIIMLDTDESNNL